MTTRQIVGVTAKAATKQHRARMESVATERGYVDLEWEEASDPFGAMVLRLTGKWPGEQRDGDDIDTIPVPK